MDLEHIENFIREICSRLGEQYAGFHTISAGKLDGEGCPDVCFHVIGGGHIYNMLVGTERTVVRNGGKQVAVYLDLTKDQFSADEGREKRTPPFREVPLTEAEFNEFGVYAGQGMRLLGFMDESNSPETVVETIHKYVDAWDPAYVSNERELAVIAMCLGLIWGHQVTRELNWEWAALEQEGRRSYAIVSPDRAYATHPTVLMAQYLQRMRENTATLLFNRLRAGDLPPSAPNTYLGLE